MVKDWDQFRVFLAVVRHGSIRGASKALGTTHATVSRHVRSLEAEVKGRLFTNDRVGRRLSELGELVLPLAQEIERQASAIERVALSASTALAGPLRISMSEILFHGVFAEIIDGFMDRYPLVEVELLASDEFASLARREADVVLRITRAPPETAVGRKLAASPLCAYAAPSYLAERPKLDRWISQAYPPAETPAIPAHIVARVNAPLAAMQMMRDGRGVGMLPCFLGDSEPGLVRLPAFAPVADRDIWLLTHKDLATAPRVRAFMDHIHGHLEWIKARVEGRAKAGGVTPGSGVLLHRHTTPATR